MVIYADQDKDKDAQDDKDEPALTRESQGVRPTAIKVELLNNLRSGVIKQQGQPLRDLIFNTNSSKCTEPRDRIYGLLGMLSPSARQESTVDYGKPIGTVFAEAVAHIFRHGKGAFMLSGMELMGHSQDPTFSSWVPKFGDKRLLKPTRFHPSGVGASGRGADTLNGSVHADLRTLRVRGLPIDAVLENITFGE